MLFGDDKEYPNPHHWGNDPISWPTSKVSSIVWKDLKDQNKMSLQDIIASFSSGYIEGYPDFDLFREDKSFSSINWDKHEEENPF